MSPSKRTRPRLRTEVPRQAPSRPRILIVDDNRDSVDALAALLRLAGNVVYTAHDDIEAIDATQRYHPDVVLLDIGMPN